MEEKSQSYSWLERLSQFLLREPKDREQLVELLHDAKQRHLLDEHALNMIEGVLQVSEMQVREIMIPRPQMVTLSAKDTLEEILPLVIDSGHSRYPITDEADPDQITGILLAKDLLPHVYQKKDMKLKEILHPVSFVPESKRLNMLLQEFRLKHIHMAIVIDEYGSIAGLVTIEDVLEQIVGEIEDEHDLDDEALIKKHSEKTFIVKAQTPLEDFNAYFQTQFTDTDIDTIGDLVVKAFGRLPKRGENITFEGFRFKVLHADHRRIRLLRLRKVASPMTLVDHA